MKKSKILFLLRNHFHKFNQNELKFIFNNLTKYELNIEKHEIVYDLLHLGENRTIGLFDDGDVEWSIEKGNSIVLHNDLGPAAHHYGVKKYLLHGCIAEWNKELQKVTII